MMAPAQACIWASTLVTYSTAFSYYQSAIPNGANVRRNGVSWPGVGHVDTSGGPSAKNQFGLDFSAAYGTWTADLCRMDSDGDGQSNGMELGDPNCVWTPGSLPERLVDISHPGFADSKTAAVQTPSTSTATTTPQVAIHAGQAIFLTAHTGRRISVIDGDVVAREGDGDAFLLEAKGPETVSTVASGNAIFLTTHNGKRVHVQGSKGTQPPAAPDSVHAYWDHKGLWQTLVIERKLGAGIIYAGDEVLLKAWTGNYLANEGEAVIAIPNTPDEWKTFIIEQAEPTEESFLLP